MLFSSRQALLRASRVRLSGGDDVKARWTLPSKDYLKYTYQPSIPDKHFMGAHWNYAPATMWLRHYRPLMEEIASSGYKTASSWVRCLTKPVSRMTKNHIPGIGHKIIAGLTAWAAFAYVARSTYGEKMEAWALLDKLHSFSAGHKLGTEGFWDTEEMDMEKRNKAATETADRLEKLWEAALAEATTAKSFQVLCDKIAVPEGQDLPLVDIPQPVSWRFGMIPFDSIDAHTFPDGDRKDVAVQVKPLHERPPVHHEEAGHGKITPKQAREIYKSAASATAATH
jgi:hypothetical protein